MLMAVRPNSLDDEPQYKVDINWEKASAFGPSISDINTTLSTAWGSSFVNQFVDRGRVKRVFVQGDALYGMRPEDFGHWYVRNRTGRHVPFSAFASGHWTQGPPKLERYNGVASTEILGQPAPGYSTGEAMAEIERQIAQLPPGVGHEWTGMSYEGAPVRRSSPGVGTCSHSSSCSCVLRRSTRAGRSRSRFCWSCRSA